MIPISFFQINVSTTLSIFCTKGFHTVWTTEFDLKEETPHKCSGPYGIFLFLFQVTLLLFRALRWAIKLSSASAGLEMADGQIEICKPVRYGGPCLIKYALSEKSWHNCLPNLSRFFQIVVLNDDRNMTIVCKVYLTNMKTRPIVYNWPKSHSHMTLVGIHETELTFLQDRPPFQRPLPLSRFFLTVSAQKLSPCM